MRQGSDRILMQFPGLQDTKQLKDLIGQTAKLTFHAVHPTVSAEEAKQTRAPIGYKVYPSARGRGRPLLRAAGDAGRLRRGSRRRAAGLRLAHQRADHLLPLQPVGRAQVRQLHQGQRRLAVRHRARRQGALGARHARADPRRIGADLGQLHGRFRNDARGSAALRRAADQADDRRGAHGRTRRSAPTPSRPASSRASSAAS